MEINDQLTVGRMGQQSLHIADSGVDPQHALLRKTSEDTYQIEDLDSMKGVYVFGIRVKRKTVREDTPIFLGTFKTSVRQLLADASKSNLGKTWADYDKEKRRWDRYTTLVNSIRMLTPVITMLLAQVVGQNWVVSCCVLVGVMAASMIAGEKVLEKRNIAMAALNAKMQLDYVCPHCHKFLGFIPYVILKEKRYCPNCGVPLNP